MKRCLFIDDEPLARMVVLEYLQGFPQIEVIQECNDGFEGLKAIQQHQPDVIFLDIQMPKINGFEMLELVEQPPAVIFATAFDEYAIRAFEAHAVDYLLKPFSKERFNKAVEKYLSQTPAQPKQQHERVVVKSGTKVKIIPVQDVLYLEADDDYVSIHPAEGSFLKNKPMSFFE